MADVVVPAKQQGNSVDKDSGVAAVSMINGHDNDSTGPKSVDVPHVKKHKKEKKHHKEKKRHKEKKHHKDKKDKEHRHKDHKEHKRKSEDRHGSPSKTPKLAVKSEPAAVDPADRPLAKRPHLAEESVLPVKKPKSETEPLSSANKMKEEAVSDYDDEDEIPLAKKKAESSKRHQVNYKETSESDDDVPLAVKKRKDSSDEDDAPLAKKKVKIEKKVAKKQTTTKGKTALVPAHSKKPVAKKPVKKESDVTVKKVKKEEDAVWEWWNEAPRDDSVKWTTLEHKGPCFPPAYERLPSRVHFRYNKEVVQLSAASEEVMGFYAKMVDHEYTTKERFQKNFFHDFRKVMTKEERDKIISLDKCDFKDVNLYYVQKNEERKNASKEEKLNRKLEAEKLVASFGYAFIDSHKEKIGNFRIEPPGLFRGRGEHPKMGKLKKLVAPENIIINCSEGTAPDPPPGHRWKEVRSDNSVSWLACWTENVQNQIKYIMFNPASRLKGEKDWKKYEKARELKKHIGRIRTIYRQDFQSKEMKCRQRAVALYFIDKLALRAGNEKDEDQADTVGCCSLRVEHIKLTEKGTDDDAKFIIEFDFLGKDSIRYQNSVEIEKRVFKNVKRFVDGKKGSDDLFDRLDTSSLNKYLTELMDGLTAKVFRTYNASITLQEQLDNLSDPDDNIAHKMLAYNRANRQVAVLCNHQRAIPKTFGKSMENLQAKIEVKKDVIMEADAEIRSAKSQLKHSKTQSNQVKLDKAKKKKVTLEEQLVKLETQRTDKDENKDIALGTSKLNYLDPRISVAWSKKFEVPIDKVYNKTQRMKFRWAYDMVDESFVF